MINTSDKLIEELNPEQAQAVLKPINECTKIVAGAGTGKTKIISKRYVKLVYDLIEQSVENPIERILVITFTDKAANEMKTRILKTLDENNINYYGQDNWISTIHSFCSKILRRHSIEIGLSPSFKLGKASELAEIYDNIITKIKYNEYKFINYIDDVAGELNINPSILSAENMMEFIAVKNLDDILTYIFPTIQKIKSLGLTPKDFLESTRIAIKEYSAKLKDFPACLPTKADYISEITNLLSEYIYRASAFDVGVFDKICKDKIIDKKGLRKPENWVRGETISDIDAITEIELKLTEIIALIYGIYQKQLAEKDVADYDDLINGTLQILENDAIRSYYKKYFKHLIIDEFQDTSLAQMKLMLALLAEDAPDITIVGDKKQSIYSFRHAKMENIDNLHTTIQNLYQKKYPEIKLKTNYRSTPEILDAVNFVTENELNLNEKLEPNPNEDFSKINSSVKLYKLTNIKSSKQLNSSQGKFIAKKILEDKEKEKLNFKDFAILTRTNGEIDDIELELKSYGIPSTKKVNTSYFKQVEIKNILALFKFVQNPRNEYALVRILNIKFSDKEIYDLKKALDDLKPEDKSFKDFNFSDKILYFMEENKIDELNVDAEIIKYTKNLYHTIQDINNKKKSMNLLKVAENLIENIKPYSGLSGNKIAIADNNIEIFKKIIFDYSKQEAYTSIKNFNEYIEQIKDDKNFVLPSVESDEVDAVNLLTVHASKGLEYPYVFLTACKNKKQKSDGYMDFELNQNKGNFGIILKTFNDNKTAQSSVYSKLYNDINQKDEALRLFYVALTRAKRFLSVLTFEAINSNSKPADYVSKLEEFTEPEIVDVEEIQLDKSPVVINKKVNINKEEEKIKFVNDKENEEDLRLNFSKLNTFSHCAYKFLNSYIYKYPVLSLENKGFAIGSIIHNLIYNSFVTSKIYNNDEIKDFIKEIELEEADITNICKTYDNFAKTKYAKLKSNEVLNEYGFEFTYKDAKFNGDIDLVIKNADDTVSVLDFKTNKNIEKSLPDYHKQLVIYKKALENKGWNVKDLILLNLKSDEVTEFILTQDEEKIAEEKLNSDIENIANAYKNNFEKIINGEVLSQPSTNCWSCEYKYACKFLTKKQPLN